MYSFQPVIDTNWDNHTGFYTSVLMSIVWVGFMVYAWAYDEVEGKTVTIWFLICLLFVSLTYYNSYQPEKVYRNTKVTGEFVQFNPEVWVEKSGKSTTTKRVMYVTYRVGNELVVLPADTGLSYPKTVVMYKN